MQNYEKNYGITHGITHIVIDETKFTEEELELGKKLVNLLCSKSDYGDNDIKNINLAFQMQEGLKNPYFQVYFDMILDYSGIVKRDIWEEVVNSGNVDYEGLARLFYNQTNKNTKLSLCRRYWATGMYAEKYMNYMLSDYSFCQFFEVYIELGKFTKNLSFKINKSITNRLGFYGEIDLIEYMETLYQFVGLKGGRVFQGVIAKKIRNYYSSHFENLSNFLLGFDKVTYSFFSHMFLDCNDTKDFTSERYYFNKCILVNTHFFNKKTKFVEFNDCIFTDDEGRKNTNVFTPKFSLSRNCQIPARVAHSFYDFLSMEFENDIKIKITGKSSWLQVFNRQYFKFTLDFLCKLKPKNKINIFIYKESMELMNYGSIYQIKNALSHNEKVFVYLDDN